MVWWDYNVHANPIIPSEWCHWEDWQIAYRWMAPDNIALAKMSSHHLLRDGLVQDPAQVRRHSPKSVVRSSRCTHKFVSKRMLATSDDVVNVEGRVPIGRAKAQHWPKRFGSSGGLKAGRGGKNLDWPLIYLLSTSHGAVEKLLYLYPFLISQSCPSMFAH